LSRLGGCRTTSVVRSFRCGRCFTNDSALDRRSRACPIRFLTRQVSSWPSRRPEFAAVTGTSGRVTTLTSSCPMSPATNWRERSWRSAMTSAVGEPGSVSPFRSSEDVGAARCAPSATRRCAPTSSSLDSPTGDCSPRVRRDRLRRCQPRCASRRTRLGARRRTRLSCRNGIPGGDQTRGSGSLSTGVGESVCQR